MTKPMEAILSRTVSQEVVDGNAAKLLAVLEGAGLGDGLDAIQIRLESHGGICPWCGKDWRLFRSDSIFGAFSFYRPECRCLSLRQFQASEAPKLREDNWEAVGIPARYAGHRFDTIDRKVSAGILKGISDVQEWVRTQGWKNGTGVILLGAVGTGKTTVAVCALKSLISQGLRGAFVQTASLADRIIRSKEDRGYIETLLQNDVLVLDDLDKVAVENDWTRSQVFGLIDSAYSKRRVMIITSSAASPADLAARFTYDVMSRILGSSQVCLFAGTTADDYRRRG